MALHSTQIGATKVIPAKPEHGDDLDHFEETRHELAHIGTGRTTLDIHRLVYKNGSTSTYATLTRYRPSGDDVEPDEITTFTLYPENVSGLHEVLSRLNWEQERR